MAQMHQLDVKIKIFSEIKLNYYVQITDQWCGSQRRVCKNILGEGWNLKILQISYLDVTSENIQ